MAIGKSLRTIGASIWVRVLGVNKNEKNRDRDRVRLRV